MNIVHIIWSFKFGGVETMLVNIANEQVKLSHKVSIIIVDNAAEDKSLISALDRRISVYNLNRKKGVISNVMTVIRMHLFLKKIEPEVIHLHSTGLYGLLIDHQYKKISCCTMHALCTPYNTKYVEKIPKLFSISKSVRQSLLNCKKLDSIVVYNGINIANIMVKATSKRSFWRIVQVGRLEHERKGQHLLIQAAKYLVDKGYKNFNISFIGEGQSMDYLKELAETLGVSDIINFAGVKTQQFIFAHLKDYDLLVQPSIEEGLGNTVVEAIAAKLPVIVSSGQGPAEIIKDGQYGIVFENGNSVDLASKIAHILTTGYEDRKVESALEYIYATFDIKQTVCRYNLLYNKK